MHGVKRLFSWMIPRFDRERFNVSLVSLRKKDLSEETLEQLGIDITYLERGKFDPLTLPALLHVIDRKRIDILHLHGYGATTFGRMAGAIRRIPTILHEHANLTDTPWFQKVADRALEPFTDIALAVSQSHRRLRRRRAPDRRLEGEGRVPRRAARGVQPAADGGGDRERPARAGHRPTRNSRSAPSRGCTIRRATRIWSTRPLRWCASGRRRASSWSGEGPLLGDLQAQAAALGLGRSLRVRRLSPRRRAARCRRST